MIRIGTVGTSAITTQFAQSVGRTAGIEIAAVFSRDAERAAELARSIGAAGVFDDYERMLASPDVDAVYVASPNGLHGEQARAALRAGKHVLVEKPAVLSVGEWDELVAEAERAGVVLLEAMRTGYDPGFTVLRSILPRLGVLRRATLRFDGLSSRYAKVLAGEQVNIFDPELGGGALRDLGVYGIHAMIALFGPPERVFGAAARIVTGAEGAGVVVGVYPGLVVDVSYSKITRSDLGSEIQGEDATVAIDHIASPRQMVVTGGGEPETLVVEGEQHALDGEVERFVDLVSTGASAEADHARTRETLRIVDALSGE